MDVAHRYDVDGIHIDDYFYPYPVAEGGAEVQFPDDASWAAYRTSGGTLSRGDWRRSNISALIERIYKGLKAERRQALFGISPFGIPRPGQPPVARGFDQYDKLYADTVLWLNKGWCDYWTPQLYWKLDAPQQPYRALLEYWIEQNTEKRHVWPGLFTSRVGDSWGNWEPKEILDQIGATRDTPGASGHVHFSMKALQRDRNGLVAPLREETYREPALIPPSPWLDQDAPAAPEVEARIEGGEVVLALKPGAGEPPFLYAIQARRGGRWNLRVLPAGSEPIKLDDASPAAEVAVTAVDRLGNASPPVVHKVQTP
jgi:uncharacterized lipoprotein YddW (UPF0748 family)